MLKEIFKHFKFDKIATEPFIWKTRGTLVEVINQSQTYFVDARRY